MCCIDGGDSVRHLITIKNKLVQNIYSPSIWTGWNPVSLSTLDIQILGALITCLIYSRSTGFAKSLFKAVPNLLWIDSVPKFSECTRFGEIQVTLPCSRCLPRRKLLWHPTFAVVSAARIKPFRFPFLKNLSLRSCTLWLILWGFCFTLCEMACQENGVRRNISALQTVQPLQIPGN